MLQNAFQSPFNCSNRFAGGPSLSGAESIHIRLACESAAFPVRGTRQLLTHPFPRQQPLREGLPLPLIFFLKLALELGVGDDLLQDAEQACGASVRTVLVSGAG